MRTKERLIALWCPNLVFIVAAACLLGLIAARYDTNLLAQPPQRDNWQSAAALRALIENIDEPSNPFVESREGSRHFQPLWVGMALIARAFELSPFQALRLAGYVSMALLATGVFFFGKLYYPSPWGPVSLLFCMLFGWVLPIEHTGFHSVFTLLNGAAYPATFMIGLGFILWAITIRSLEKPRNWGWIFLLATVMFAIHQLGAVIDFIIAICIAAFNVRGTVRSRIMVILAIVAGLLASSLWPYHRPIELVFEPGNSTWQGGPRFYSFDFLLGTFFPSLVGILGLLHREARPFLVALAIFLACSSLGVLGIQLGGRFLMPCALVLHIGLATVVVKLGHEIKGSTGRGAIGVYIGLASYLIMQVTLIGRFMNEGLEDRSSGASVYTSALRLTQDIADSEQIAAFHETAWPIVATGQKVLSIPWPEPAIRNLSERQAITSKLFDPNLPSEERILLMDRANVPTLIVDRRMISGKSLGVLKDQADEVRVDGYFARFDFWK